MRFENPVTLTTFDTVDDSAHDPSDPGLLVGALRERIRVLECQNIELELQEKELRTQTIRQQSAQLELERTVEEARLLYQRQKDTEHRYRQLFDLAPIGYLSLNSEGVIDKVNLAASCFLKQPSSRILKTPFTDFLAIEDKQLLHEHLLSVATTRLSDKWLVSLLLPNGSSVQVMLVTSAIHNRSHDSYSYQILIVDISEQLANEKLLRNANSFLEELAHHDPLTKLPNRTLFRDNLQSLINQRTDDLGSIGVIYFDLDGFKPINDSLGHAAGDQLLKGVAQRVRGLLREGDSMARLGGDEFTIIMDSPAGTEEAMEFARSVAEAIREPFHFEEATVSVSGSVGVCLFPDHAKNLDNLVKGADASMYKAKQAGRDQVVMFTHESLETVSRLSTLESGLTSAIADEQLQLHYQPIYDSKTLRVVSVEALIRWNHPTLGIVSPGEFIPLAEKTGRIVHIGQWVLEQACRQAQKWRASGIVVPISINVSSKQIIRHDFPQQVVQTLAHYNLPCSAIEIELTETAIIFDHAQCKQSLCQLRDKGVLITIDDFGTGYSSLGRLAQLPVSRLKIDRLFIKQIVESASMQSITKSIIEMAHELDMYVVSEGIESQSQLEFLVNNGCDAVQGFMMSRAEPSSDITRLLELDVQKINQPCQDLQSAD